MHPRRPPPVLGYVKVALRSRAPRRLWGWEVYRDGDTHAVLRSDETFGYAEDAWAAGQAALAALPPPTRPGDPAE